jgi:hypothetical protein
MSDIFVDNIKHQSSQGSGTITIGASGETITVPTGVTLDTTSATQNRPAFQVGRSTNQTLSDGTNTVIAFDISRFDIGSNYSTSTYRFTAPKAGRYFFTTQVRIDNAPSGGYVRCYFGVNGNSGYSGSNFNYGHVISGGNHSTDYESFSVSAVLNLSVNDYVQVFAGKQGNTTANFQGESQFSGYFLG